VSERDEAAPSTRAVLVEATSHSPTGVLLADRRRRRLFHHAEARFDDVPLPAASALGWRSLGAEPEASLPTMPSARRLW
jgi:hypothetical protein